MANKKIKQPDKQELMGNRIALHMSIAVVCFAVLIFYDRMLDTLQGITKFQPAVLRLIVIAGILFVAAIVNLIIVIARKVDYKQKIVHPVSLTLWGAAILLGSVAMYFQYLNAIKAMYVLLVFFLAVYIVRAVYENDFFYLSVMMGFALIVFYIFSRIGDNPGIIPLMPVVSIAIVVVALLAALITFLVRRNGGQFKTGKGAIVLFEKDAAYFPLFIFYAIVAVGGAFMLAFTTEAAYYSALAVGISILLAALYYTIRLMNK
ncbi:MAG: hypothetical protein Q8865_06610 [Bacillota bacterium]|nr:hypothetical protein [Bacillota bacterium]